MKPSQAAPIEIDIWSDVVCPFCYIGRTDYLMDVAAQAGLDQAVIREALGDAALEKEIDADSMTAQRLGIQGVPFFRGESEVCGFGSPANIDFCAGFWEKVRDEMKPVNRGRNRRGRVRSGRGVLKDIRSGVPGALIG